MTGEELEKIRIRLGWTKKELAKRIGVTEVTVNKYIKHNTTIPKPVENLVRIFDKGVSETLWSKN